ncbi:MAG TPA: ATP-binding protein [Candidatus Angelobacter sp.]|jgi:molecular chaperone HtpG|nr:ATP-binding protein [Candidatus Angelobacter sp.]
MSTSRPVLTSIKSNWEPLNERPIVGKDVLELLSSSMYVNALSVYREYVQNSADAIEEAAALGLLGAGEKGRIDITVDVPGRSVRIRDNGTGLSKTVFTKTLIALGASKKRGTKARGFRGVGRLAGLGYCKELVFRSRVDGESEVTELRWDCVRLKSSLRDASFRGDLEELIRDVVRVGRSPGAGFPARFFEVEMSEIIRHGNDSLINSDHIHNYLSQVAPVPFAPNFRFTKRITDKLRSKISLGDVLIYLNGNKGPIYRPHRNEFEVRKGVVDQFKDVKFFELKTADDRMAAIGWILDHEYQGAIDRSVFIKGLRLRMGNMQVGESNLLDDLFPEPRFNSWVVGEIHVIDERILPNGRRDHFEQNVPFNDLRNQLGPTAKQLSRSCRVSSQRRNVVRQFQALQREVEHNLSVNRQGAAGLGEIAKCEKDSIRQLKRMEKISSHSSLQEHQQSKLTAVVNRLRRRVESEFKCDNEHRALRALKKSQKQHYERIISLIYECSVNKAAAKQLVDRILNRLS